MIIILVKQDMDNSVLVDKDYFITIFGHASYGPCISKYLITLLDKIPFISLVFTVISLNALENEEKPDVTLEEETDEEEEKKRKFDPLVRMPKWLRIILMFLPAFIYTAIILLVDHYVGFPDTINPMALIAIPGLALFFLVVIGDMVYRNFFMYKMMRSETRKTRVYRQIIKERKEEQSAKDRYEYEEAEDDDEYDYDDDDEESEEGEDEELKVEEEKEEYVYDTEDELTEDEYYRMKSYLLRGGIMTILLVNAIVLLGLAAIFQLILGEGFIVTE